MLLCKQPGNCSEWTIKDGLKGERCTGKLDGSQNLQTRKLAECIDQPLLCRPARFSPTFLLAPNGQAIELRQASRDSRGRSARSGRAPLTAPSIFAMSGGPMPSEKESSLGKSAVLALSPFLEANGQRNVERNGI